jgi:uncharacterized membrane protein
MTRFLKLYAVSAVVFLALDLFWLGIVARGFYQRHLGSLMRPDVRWGPALLFYAIYLAALVVFVVGPAFERRSLAQAVGLGAFFGLAAYATFDLTSLALIRDFPLRVAVVDLIWGAVLSATVSGLAYGAAAWLRA